jgi:hypothetical protein
MQYFKSALTGKATANSYASLKPKLFEEQGMGRERHKNWVYPCP